MTRYNTSECGERISEALYEECFRRWPQFFHEGFTVMTVHAEEGDPVVPEILTFLNATGREPYLKRTPSLANCPQLWKTHFQVVGERKFEQVDYSNAELFWVQTELGIASTQLRLDDGRLCAMRSTFTGEPIGNIVGDRVVVCTEGLRRGLDKAAFVGLQFRPVEIADPASSQAEAEGPPLSEALWQLWSEREMPAVLNPVVNVNGYPNLADGRNGCVIDDLYYPWLFRFPRAEVRDVEPFDVAFTRERFGPKTAANNPGAPDKLLDPQLIVSRRFRTWCVKRGLKLVFYPVVLE